MIAADAGVHRATVFAHLSQLEDGGKISRITSKGRNTNRYQVTVPAGYDPSDDKWDQDSGQWTTHMEWGNRRNRATVNRSDRATVQDAQPSHSDDSTVAFWTFNRSDSATVNRRDGATQPLSTSIEPLSTSDEPTTEIADEVEAALDDAAKRKTEEKILGGTVIHNPAGYQRTTKENLREEWAEVIDHFRREGWSAEELADKIAPVPYVAPVPKGASKNPEVMFCDGHHCYLTQCPPASGHRYVHDRKHGQETYGGETFSGWRLWDPNDDQGALFTRDDGSVWKACWCNTSGAVDCPDCGNTGSVLFSPAQSAPIDLAAAVP
jgi:hypothetical protein